MCKWSVTLPKICQLSMVESDAEIAEVEEKPILVSHAQCLLVVENHTQRLWTSTAGNPSALRYTECLHLRKRRIPHSASSKSQVPIDLMTTAHRPTGASGQSRWATHRRADAPELFKGLAWAHSAVEEAQARAGLCVIVEFRIYQSFYLLRFCI